MIHTKLRLYIVTDTFLKILSFIFIFHKAANENFFLLECEVLVNLVQAEQILKNLYLKIVFKVSYF